MQVPETLIGSALAIALLPSVSELFARGDHRGFRATVNGAVRTILALTIPAAILLCMGLRPLLERAFPVYTPAEVDLIVWITRLYLAGLTGHALLEIGSRSFYAQQEARTPMWAAGINSALFVGLAIALTGRMGAGGIALAGTIAFTLEAIVLLWLLARRYPGLGEAGSTLLRTAIGSLLGAGALYAVMQWAPLPGVVAALGGMVLGMLLAMAVLWPDLKVFAQMASSADKDKNPQITADA